ncbi:hypothetical protein GWI33_003470 [Rhynchophorus ferrugineus]|uniref:Uncharacterized protein n=1 Tax=Rhynchophorus ferrugineus TaxID=354439 RepID=A0A834IXW3_RHYFE|nr:hypothetical protein GWI33_003470 [Rhynchophorus ferrugineus]
MNQASHKSISNVLAWKNRMFDHSGSDRVLIPARIPHPRARRRTVDARRLLQPPVKPQATPPHLSRSPASVASRRPQPRYSGREILVTFVRAMTS